MNKDLIFQIIDWQEYNERIDLETEQIDYNIEVELLSAIRCFYPPITRSEQKKCSIRKNPGFPNWEPSPVSADKASQVVQRKKVR